MPDPSVRTTRGPLFLRVQSGQLLAPDDVAELVENMRTTPDGTMESIIGPCPYNPLSGGVYVNGYTNVHGIYHAALKRGQRSCLLLHNGTELWEFAGWNHSWTVLIGATGRLNRTLSDTAEARFPCQFETTPTGVVIVPQGENDRAFFYDGEVILPLGYDTRPAPPTGMGPSADDVAATIASATLGYGGTWDISADRLQMATGGVWGTDEMARFGYGRLGTAIYVDGYAADAAGVYTNVGRLLRSSYTAAYQWIDYFGNISPLSERASPVEFPQQDALGNGGGAYTDCYRPEVVQKEIYWSAIMPGPDGTVGRIVSHTRDTINSGTTDLFEHTGDCQGGASAPWATIPDNETESFAWNIPDSWLVRHPVDCMPVPVFRVCSMALGRLWIGNFLDEPGAIAASMPGQWGTFLRKYKMHPDPKGSDITGLHPVENGLLAFTAYSTFLITPSDDGLFYRSRTIHSRIGCIAPSSIKTFTDGRVFWLGADGFYAFDGEGVVSISDDIGTFMREMTSGRALQSCAVVDVKRHEYLCWVPMYGSIENQVCWVYNGRGWKQRADTRFVGVCQTNDEKAYIVGCGDDAGYGLAGVWVLDHQVRSFPIQTRYATIETAWLSAGSSRERKTALTVYLWLRETSAGNVTVTLYRDWVKSVQETTTINLKSDQEAVADETCALWNSGLLDADGTYMNKKRPHWARADIYIPSCEVYKIKLTSSYPMEFLGMMIDETPKGPGPRVPP